MTLAITYLLIASLMVWWMCRAADSCKHPFTTNYYGRFRCLQCDEFVEDVDA